MWIRWSRVAGVDLAPPWFVEAVRRRWFTGARTFARSLLPWRFWRSLRMTMPIREAVASYPLRLVIPLYLLLCAACGARTAALLNPIVWQDPPAAFAAIAGATLCPWLDEPVDRVIERWKPGWCLQGVRAKKGYMAKGPNWFGERTMSVPPARIAGECLRGIEAQSTLLVLALAGSVTAFAALPIARRRAKVRWRHVIRVAVYAAGLLVVLIAAGWAIDVFVLVRSRHGLGSMSVLKTLRVPPVEVLFIPVMLALWWWSASRHYLKLERPMAVALSVTAIGSLAALLVLFALRPRIADDWLNGF